jgi:hypothetical protein
MKSMKATVLTMMLGCAFMARAAAVDAGKLPPAAVRSGVTLRKHVPVGEVSESQLEYLEQNK